MNGQSLSSTAVDTAPTRRERRKARTGVALREAALHLFATQGYESTTTEEIAERAEVSGRTFFRYFATKESVLFADRRTWMQSFVAVFLGQPAHLSDLDALATTFRQVGSTLTERRANLLLYERAVASSPTLRGREYEHRLNDLAVVASAIATRRGRQHPDENCRLLADIGVLTHNRGLDRWLAGPDEADLSETIADEFVRLADIMAGS